MREKIGRVAIEHPRLTLAVVGLVAFVAVQGGVAAVEGGVSGAELGTGSNGPTDPGGGSDD